MAYPKAMATIPRYRTGATGLGVTADRTDYRRSPRDYLGGDRRRSPKNTVESLYVGKLGLPDNEALLWAGAETSL
jgi:hypothetical protein